MTAYAQGGGKVQRRRILRASRCFATDGGGDIPTDARGDIPAEPQRYGRHRPPRHFSDAKSGKMSKKRTKKLPRRTLQNEKNVLKFIRCAVGSFRTPAARSFG